MRSIWEGLYRRLTRPVMAGMVASLLLAGCGGGGVGTTTSGSSSSSSSSSSSTSSSSSSGSTVAAAGVQLLVSAPQIKSDGSEKIALRVVVTDTNGIVIPTKNVALSVTDTSSTGGVFLDTISSTTYQTDANGQLTANLNVGIDKTNRTVTVKAVVDSQTATANVDVVGTTLLISGSNSMVFNGTTDLTVTVKDSAGKAVNSAKVNFTSAKGNTIASTATTNTNGQAKVTVTATKSGADTITATSLGATATQTLTVSAADFQFLTSSGFVLAGDAIDVNTSKTVGVKWLENGIAKAGATVIFTITRGTITSAASVITDASGIASANFQSSQVGAAKITATGQVLSGDAPSGSIDISYVTKTASSITLQADKTTLPANTAGSETYQSRVTATIRDAANNLVKNASVSFSLVADESRGKLTLSSAVTDENGQASVYYIAGTTPSSQNGVQIRAVVQDISGVPLVNSVTTVADQTVSNHDLQMTVGGQALYVRLGTGNKVSEPDETRNAQKWTALVTDAAGNPVSNQQVQFILRPLEYAKGLFVSNGTKWVQSIAITCTQEDTNYNGILDTGEDINNNGKLTPGNVATVSSSTSSTGGSSITLTSGDNGFVDVYVMNPKSYAGWVKVVLQAKMSVQGTESSDSYNFYLWLLASDYSDLNVTPPGQPSPFGTTADCTSTN